MLCANDQRHIEYCVKHNNGKCMYLDRICDGICNNCGLDAPPEKHPTCNGSGTIVCITNEAYFNLPI